MSQKNVDFMKKNKYQFKKQITPPDDYESIRATQEIFNAQMDGTEIFLDADMPIDPFDTTVDWSVGPAPNDEIFRATKNKHIAEEDLGSGVYEPIKDLSGTLPYGLPKDYTFTITYYDIAVFHNKIILAGAAGIVHSFDLFSETLETDGAGISNDGSATGLFDIRKILIKDDLLIFVTVGNKIATYDYSTDTWNAHNSGTPYTNTTNAAFGENITGSSIILDGDTLIVAGIEGVASHDGTAWKNYDGTGTGTGIFLYYNELGLIEGRDEIISIIRYNQFIVCSTIGAAVFNHNGTGWTDYLGGGEADGPFTQGYMPLARMVIYETDLLFIAWDSVISSYDTNGLWKFFDGTGTGSGLYNNTVYSQGNINMAVVYHGDLILFGNQTRDIAYYDGSSWHTPLSNNKYACYTFNNNQYAINHTIYNDSIYIVGYANSVLTMLEEDNGDVSVYQRIGFSDNDNPFLTREMPTTMTSTTSIKVNCGIQFGDYLVFGCDNGEIFYYNTSLETWHAYDDAGTGPNSIGVGGALEGKAIYTMQYYSDCLIIAGETGYIAYWNSTDDSWYASNNTQQPGEKDFNGRSLIVGTSNIIAMPIMESIDEICIVSSDGRVGSMSAENGIDYLGATVSGSPTTIYYDNATASYLTLSEVYSAIVMKPRSSEYKEYLVLGSSGQTISCDNANAWQANGAPVIDNPFTNIAGTGFSGTVFGMVQFKGYLIAFSSGGYASCDWNGAWSSYVPAEIQDPVSIWKGSWNGNIHVRFPELVYKTGRKPDYVYEADENSAYLGLAYTNRLGTTRSLDLSTWPLLGVTSTATGEILFGKTTDNDISTLFGQEFYEVVALDAVDTSHVTNFMREPITAVASTNVIFSVIARKGTADESAVRIDNQSVSNTVIGTALIDFTTQSVTSTDSGVLISQEWFDNDTVRIYMHVSGTLSAGHNLNYRLYANYGTGTGVIGASTKYMRPMVTDVSMTHNVPWNYNVQALKIITDTSYTLPESFTIVTEFTPTFNYDTSTYNYIYSFYEDSSHYARLSYSTNDYFYFKYYNGASVQNVVGPMTGIDLNQKIRVYNSINRAAKTITTAMYLEEDDLFFIVTYTSSIAFNASYINNLYIGGKDTTTTQPANTNIYGLKVYDGITFDGSYDTIEKIEELFPKDSVGIVGRDTNGFEMTKIDDTGVYYSDEGSIYTGIRWIEIESGVGAFETDDSIYMIDTTSQTTTLDKRTGAFATKDKIFYK